ncbi:MAG: AEC family transporter, partial [Acetatifactor sp.]|nr:AEC family transporter [Acetatifactor sp.]
ILGILLGMAVSVCQISFPVIVTKTINNISVLATPLALLGLGAGFEGRKALRQIKPTIVATLLKLVIQPAFFLPLAIYMGFRGEMLVALLVMLGAPTTVSCYIMAKNMGHEGTLTSSVVVATTFLSSVTLTIFLFVLRSMGYI